MMNQYRNPSPRIGGCGCGRGREATPQPSRAFCGSAASRRTPCGGNTPMTRTTHGYNPPVEGASCPLNRSHGHDHREGCGCGGDHGARLMDQIRAVDFALYETVLYLDVYPHSCDALENYRKLKAQSEALHKEYETTHAPLTAFGNESETSWDWMSKPFPWEYDAD